MAANWQRPFQNPAVVKASAGRKIPAPDEICFTCQKPSSKIVTCIDCGKDFCEERCMKKGTLMCNGCFIDRSVETSNDG